MKVMHKELINLLKGWPNPALLPAAQIKTLSSTALSDTEIFVPGLLYGPDPGYEPLRANIAKWLTQFYQPPEPIPAERICITGGASQNLACILQVFSDPLYTRNVWMVSPTYHMACRMFEDSGFHGRLCSVPEDDEGLDVAYLRKAIKQSEDDAREKHNTKPTLKPKRASSKIYRHLIYAVPTFSNPSSKSMSLQRRQELVQIAREYDACIITDDVYDLLQWPAHMDSTESSIEHAQLPRIVDIDRWLSGGAERPGADGFGNAVSNGSFSKIAGPGCRTGWAEGTKKFAWGVSQVGSSKSGGAPSQLTATFMSGLLESGDLQHHVFQTLQPSYARRYKTIMSAVEQNLTPLGVTLPQASRIIIGGYFIWLTLPAPLYAEEVAIVAKRDQNLIIAPGPMFAVYGDETAIDLRRKVRLCFSWEEEHRLAEGIQRLGQVIADIQKTKGKDKTAAPCTFGKGDDLIGQYN
ncbi:Valine--pyruvate aminotransferase [Lecanora helva]